MVLDLLTSTNTRGMERELIGLERELIGTRRQTDITAKDGTS